MHNIGYIITWLCYRIVSNNTWVYYQVDNNVTWLCYRIVSNITSICSRINSDILWLCYQIGNNVTCLCYKIVGIIIWLWYQNNDTWLFYTILVKLPDYVPEQIVILHDCATKLNCFRIGSNITWLCSRVVSNIGTCVRHSSGRPSGGRLLAMM